MNSPDEVPFDPDENDDAEAKPDSVIEFKIDPAEFENDQQIEITIPPRGHEVGTEYSYDRQRRLIATAPIIEYDAEELARDPTKMLISPRALRKLAQLVVNKLLDKSDGD